jgi:hypothetical protein
MNELYHIFPGSPVYESPEDFEINLKYNSFPQLLELFKRTKMSFFYNAINYDTKTYSGTSIRTLNMLLFLSTVFTLFNTGSKSSEKKERKS